MRTVRLIDRVAGGDAGAAAQREGVMTTSAVSLALRLRRSAPDPHRESSACPLALQPDCVWHRSLHGVVSVCATSRGTTPSCAQAVARNTHSPHAMHTQRWLLAISYWLLAGDGDG